jgi:hypothetical protein
VTITGWHSSSRRTWRMSSVAGVLPRLGRLPPLGALSDAGCPALREHRTARQRRILVCMQHAPRRTSLTCNRTDGSYYSYRDT